VNFLSKFFLTVWSLYPVEISQRNYLVLFFRQNSENESSLIEAFNGGRYIQGSRAPQSATIGESARRCIRRRTHGLCISAADN